MAVANLRYGTLGFDVIVTSAMQASERVTPEMLGILLAAYVPLAFEDVFSATPGVEVNRPPGAPSDSAPAPAPMSMRDATLRWAIANVPLLLPVLLSLLVVWYFGTGLQEERTKVLERQNALIDQYRSMAKENADRSVQYLEFEKLLMQRLKDGAPTDSASSSIRTPSK